MGQESFIRLAQIKLATLHRRSALTQVGIVSLSCFCCPGLFNALTSFASGIDDPAVAYNGNSLVYFFFSLFGLLAGAVTNMFGPKLTLFIGTCGYVLYAISLYVIQWKVEKILHSGKEHAVYTVFGERFYYTACCLLGVCASLLWTAQGQICMAYPTNESKGMFFSLFWVIFNLGATIGGLLSFVINYHVDYSNSDASGSTTAMTYVLFIFMMAAGSLLTVFLVNPSTVERNDGTMVVVAKLPHWKDEAKAFFMLFTEKKMLLLLPLFAYSNWFYTYHSFYNITLFNVRTSGLSTSFYWGSQMVGSFLIGKFLDRPGVSIKTKALSSVYIIGVLTFLMWGIGFIAQKILNLQYGVKQNLDFKDFYSYLPKLLLYIFYGFNDSICQVWSYWLMGQMSDDMRILGHYAAYYKAIQSGSAAISWKIGGLNVDPTAQLLINWLFSCAGIVGAFFSIKLYLLDPSTIQSGMVDSDIEIQDFKPIPISETSEPNEAAVVSYKKVSLADENTEKSL